MVFPDGIGFRASLHSPFPMMSFPKFWNERRGALLFCLVFALALIWAASTQHVWEDYYITYRSSKNLATGQGLVFTPGERLHTFTSPLGVLLPAAANWLTGHDSDTAAIWLFRVWSAAALAGAVVLIQALAKRQNFSSWALVALVGWAMFDGKSLDFTINGMETGLLLLFIAYACWALFVDGKKRWIHLGFAWAGLMWTRPDSFLYVGLLSIGAWLFNKPSDTGVSRRDWVLIFLKAGILCTVVYLPWFLWAWSYYGSPIPHTIMAKGGVVTESKTLLGALKVFLSLPFSVWRGETSLEAAFLPSYFQIGGWPPLAVQLARGAGLVIAFQWILPWRMLVRIASLTFCGMHVYLSYYPFFPFPWYLPGTAFLAAIVLGGMVSDLSRLGEFWPGLSAGGRRALQGALALGVLLLLGMQTWLSWQIHWQVKTEQELSATGVRRRVGEWLHDHAKPGDNVFMEPLGHIGYFSGLKTYDYPGLSSLEVVRAVRIFKTDWALIVDYLSPDWVVLRPFEFDRMNMASSRLFSETYTLAAEFNTVDQIRSRPIYGRPYVEHDAHMRVFHRVKPKRFQVDATNPAVLANFPLPIEAFGEVGAYKLHATGVISFRVPPGSRHVKLSFGLPPGTYQGNVVTDGVEFRARCADAKGQVSDLFRMYLDPVKNPADRGLKEFVADLPLSPDTDLILSCLAGPTDAMDWSCWLMPEFSK